MKVEKILQKYLFLLSLLEMISITFSQMKKGKVLSLSDETEIKFYIENNKLNMFSNKEPNNIVSIFKTESGVFKPCQQTGCKLFVLLDYSVDLLKDEKIAIIVKFQETNKILDLSLYDKNLKYITHNELLTVTNFFGDFYLKAFNTDNKLLLTYTIHDTSYVGGYVGIRGRIYTNDLTEFKGDTQLALVTEGKQHQVKSSIFSGDSFNIVFNSSDRIKTRIFNSQIISIISKNDIEIDVDEKFVFSTFKDPSSIVLKNSNFVVSWIGYDTSTSPAFNGIFFKIFDKKGIKKTSPIRIDLSPEIRDIYNSHLVYELSESKIIFLYNSEKNAYYSIFDSYINPPTTTINSIPMIESENLPNASIKDVFMTKLKNTHGYITAWENNSSIQYQIFDFDNSITNNKMLKKNSPIISYLSNGNILFAWLDKENFIWAKIVNGSNYNTIKKDFKVNELKDEKNKYFKILSTSGEFIIYYQTSLKEFRLASYSNSGIKIKDVNILLYKKSVDNYYFELVETINKFSFFWNGMDDNTEIGLDIYEINFNKDGSSISEMKMINIFNNNNQHETRIKVFTLDTRKILVITWTSNIFNNIDHPVIIARISYLDSQSQTQTIEQIISQQYQIPSGQPLLDSFDEKRCIVCYTSENQIICRLLNYDGTITENQKIIKKFFNPIKLNSISSYGKNIYITIANKNKIELIKIDENLNLKTIKNIKSIYQTSEQISSSSDIKDGKLIITYDERESILMDDYSNISYKKFELCPENYFPNEINGCKKCLRLKELNCELGINFDYCSSPILPINYPSYYMVSEKYCKDASIKTFDKCDQSCKSCFEESNKCRICNSDFFSVDINHNDCRNESTKPYSYVKNANNIYSLCHLNRIPLENSTTCIEASLGKYYDEKSEVGYKIANDRSKYIECHISCKYCKDIIDRCEECNLKRGYFPLIDNPEKCLKSPPNGYVLNQNINTYQKCDISCLICKDHNFKEKCEICKEGYLRIENNPGICTNNIQIDGYLFNSLTNRFELCEISCSKCLLKKDNCLKCTEGYFPLFDKINLCIKKENSPIGYMFEPVTGFHEKCSDNCSTCIDTKVKCTSCKDNMLLNRSLNKCFGNCSSGFYRDLSNKYCEKCLENCFECENEKLWKKM